MLRQGSKSPAHIAREQRVVLKRGRHEREHSFFDRETFEKLCFQAIVKAGRVADIFFQDMEPGTDGKFFADFVFFSAEPAAIGDNGIDFAVVSDVAERLGKVPGRLRVGGISLVKNDERGLKRGLAKVLIELRKLPRRQEALVHNCLRRKGTHITSSREQRLSFLAKERQTPFKSFRGTGSVKRSNKELPRLRHGFESTTTEAIRIYGNAPPAKDAKAFLIGGSLDGGFRRDD